MRNATQEERESVDNYIESISIQTGVTFDGALHGEIPQLTFEQLKAEADRHGYNLVKKPQYVRFLPCTCGCNKRHTFYSMKRITWNVGYKCARCGKEAFGKNTEDAKLNWNKMIRRQMIMEQIKNVTEKEKLHRLAEYDFTLNSKLDCIQYIDELLKSTKSTEEVKMLKSISYYLQELNGQFILEPWCVLHDGGEYPYVGQKVCCYNAIGETTTMVYNPDADPNYEWMYNGQKVLAWCPDPFGNDYVEPISKPTCVDSNEEIPNND